LAAGLECIARFITSHPGHAIIVADDNVAKLGWSGSESTYRHGGLRGSTMSTRRLIGRLSAVELLATGRTRTKTCSSRKGSDVRYFVLRRKYISGLDFQSTGVRPLRNTPTVQVRTAPARKKQSQFNDSGALSFSIMAVRLQVWLTASSQSLNHQPAVGTSYGRNPRFHCSSLKSIFNDSAVDLSFEKVGPPLRTRASVLHAFCPQVDRLAKFSMVP